MSKITGYGAIASVQSDDVLPVVDVHDTTMAGTGTTKKITLAQLLQILTQTPVKTANYTAAANQIVPVDTTSGAVTVTLPTAPAAGTLLVVKLVTKGGSNTVTVTCGGSDVFNKAGGGTTGTLTLPFQGMLLQYSGAGIWMVLADDLALSQLDLRYLALTGGVLTGALSAAPVTLTDAASITLSAAASNFFRVTLGGNRTLASPTSPTDGQSIVVEVIQDGTGSRTLAYGTAYSFPASIGTPVLSTAPGSRDFLAFTYNADDTTWFCTAFVPASAPAVPATVAQGGTGDSSLTAYGVLAGGTTSTAAVQSVAPGSSGNVLTSNGVSALPSFQAAASGFANPMTTLGDLIIENATPAPARLAGDTSNTRKFLRTQASAAVAQAPAWDTLVAGDLPAATTGAQGAVILDGTATDIKPSGVQLAGATGKAADAGHIHQNNADLSLLVAPTGATGETYPRQFAGVYFTIPTSGTVYASAIPLPGGLLINSLAAWVGSTAFTGVTHGWYALLDSSYVVRAVTADQSGGNWGTTFTKVSLSVAASAYTTPAAGLYYFAFCAVFTGAGTFPAAANPLSTLGSTAPVLFGASSTGQTTPPTTGTTLTTVSAAGITNGRFHAITV